MRIAAPAPPPALAAVALALVAALAAAGAAHHALWAGAQGSTGLELLHAGTAVLPPLVELPASREPAMLELVASGVGSGAEVSVRVVRSSSWGGDSGAAPPAAPTLDNHGGGEATLTLDRSSPGELVLEAAASGASGEARTLYVVRVLDALPHPGVHDRAAPSYIVGGVDPDDLVLPRILAQAGLPLCADARVERGGVGMMAAFEVGAGSKWQWSPTLSGVPPIEGVALLEAEVSDPTGETTSDHPSWWGCYTAALFGTQVPQWIYMCDVPGSDRTRYYAREWGSPSAPGSSTAINPYTGELNRFPYRHNTPQAAAPGPSWLREGDAYASGSTLDVVETLNALYFGAPESDRVIYTMARGTLSSVPEFLPFDGKVVLRATAFHSDNVVFRTSQPMGAPLAIPDRLATVNGTTVPTESFPEPHYHSGSKQQFRNGTEIRHHPKAHGLEAVIADRMDPQTPSSPHHHHTPWVTASVRVSDIALRNGVLIEGITDGIADLPRHLQLELLRARGVHGDPDVGAMEVKRLHEITLVAELPVHVPHVGDYARIDPGLSIAPWECWPRLNHPASCPEVEPGAGCPPGPSGAAWVP